MQQTASLLGTPMERISQVMLHRQAEAWEEARKEKEAATAAAQGRKPREKRFKPVWELVKINRNRQAVAAEVG